METLDTILVFKDFDKPDEAATFCVFNANLAGEKRSEHA